ncbi:hypothetical protein ACLOJK_021291 [Asimina triloba]
MGGKPGDWYCQAFNHLNFSRRGSCQRCSEAREQAVYMIGGSSNDIDVKAGDWYCIACGTHDFASRSYCFSCKALRGESGAPYDVDQVQQSRNRPDWKPGDWLCTR